MTIAIEKKSSLPLKIKINPDIIADITNNVPTIDILLKKRISEFNTI